MNRFLFILTIIFFVGFVVQQSQVIERVLIYDRLLGVQKEEYRLNWDNLDKYRENTMKKIRATTHYFKEKSSPKPPANED